MEQVDVVVVGAGAMGATAAWRLARSGRSVVLLERFGPGHTHGSSHGTTRIFRLAYRDPVYVRFAAQALDGWRELEAASGEVLLEQVGQLDHGRAAAVDEVVANLRAADRPVERLDAAEASERWPGMRFDGAVAFSPDGGRCLADRTVATSQRLAGSAGAAVHFDEPAERIEVVGDRAVVHSAGRSWDAAAVVVAAGAWVSSLLGQLVSLPPITIESDQPSHFAPIDASASWPSFLHHGLGADGVDRPLSFDAYGLWTPGEGVKVGGHGTVAVCDPEDLTRVPDPVRTESLVRYVEEWLPGLDPTPRSTVSCLFTSTDDEHFILDRRGPLVVCSPCSGHGFKFVPAIAAEVERLVTRGGQPVTEWRLPN